MALLQPESTVPEEKPSRNIVATKLTLGPKDQMGRRRIGALHGISEKKDTLGPLAFLYGASMLDAFKSPEESQ